MYWKFKALFLCFTYIFMDIACICRGENIPSVTYTLNFDFQKHPFTCGETIHVDEGNRVYVTITADNKYINEAWCTNALFKNREELEFDLEKKKVYFDIPTVDFFNGCWNCTLLTSKNVNALKNMSVLYNNHYYVQMDCLINVAINYQFEVTIINRDTFSIKKSISESWTYHFKDGENVKISCGRQNQTSKFTFGKLKIEHCDETKCSVQDHGIHREVKYEIQLQNHNDQNQMICTYTTHLGKQYNSVIFTLDSDLPPVIELEGISPSSENVYEITAAGANYTASCKRREPRGTIQWKIEISSTNTFFSEKKDKPLIARIVDPTTILKTAKLSCVYTNSLNHTMTTDVKFVIMPSTCVPPVIELEGISPSPENVYEIIAPGPNYTASCKRGEQRGTIQWKFEISSTIILVSEEKDQPTIKQTIDPTALLNTAKLSCVYTNPFNHTMTTDVKFVVVPSTCNLSSSLIIGLAVATAFMTIITVSTLAWACRKKVALDRTEDKPSPRLSDEHVYYIMHE